jgi:hypothetical protein
LKTKPLNSDREFSTVFLFHQTQKLETAAPRGDRAGILASWHLRDKIEEVVKGAARKGFDSADNELAVDVAFAFLDAVNLAHRDFHNLSQFRKVLISTRA